jgi:hypothetical protein
MIAALHRGGIVDAGFLLGLDAADGVVGCACISTDDWPICSLRAHFAASQHAGAQYRDSHHWCGVV